MASLRALKLARVGCAHGSFAVNFGRSTVTNNFNYQRRHASFYNSDVAGLTEEEAEVRILNHSWKVY
jgi:hypothetical protein